MKRAGVLCLVLCCNAFAVPVQVGDRIDAVRARWGAPAAYMTSANHGMVLFTCTAVDLLIHRGRVAILDLVPVGHLEKALRQPGWETHGLPAGIHSGDTALAAAAGDGQLSGDIKPGVRTEQVLSEWGQPMWRLTPQGNTIFRYPGRLVEIMLRDNVVESVVGLSRARTAEAARMYLGREAASEYLGGHGEMFLRRYREVHGVPPTAEDNDNGTATLRMPFGMGASPAQDRIASDEHTRNWTDIVAALLAPFVIAVIIVTAVLSIFLAILLRPTRSDPHPWQTLKRGPSGIVRMMGVLIGLWCLGVALLVVYFALIPFADVLIRLELLPGR